MSNETTGTVARRAPRTLLIDGLPRGIVGPHLDRPGPCNDPGCRLCDAVRAQLRQWAERRVKHLERKGLVR